MKSTTYYDGSCCGAVFGGSSEAEPQSEVKELSSLCSGLHELPAKVNRGKKKLNISDVRNPALSYLT
ncbi:hypothetical protein AOLI_G00200120 [Acnodon oligacanthus]